MSVIEYQPISSAPPAPPRRPRVQLIGTAFASVAAFMTIGGLTATYIAVRSEVISGGSVWLPTGVVMALTPANMGFITMLMTSVVIQWAVYSMGNEDRAHAYLAIGLFLLLSFAFIVQESYYCSQMGLAINGEAKSSQGLLIFAIVGAHLAMVGAGMIYAAFMGFRALGGQLTGRDREGISAAALFWHVTVAAYAIVWYAIFITK